MKATQLLYVTTDELGRRTLSATTVVQPLHEARSAHLHLVSYQEAYDALGPQCDPSYGFPSTLRHEGLVVASALRYLAAGDTMVISDYEGRDLAFGAGQQSGYETLDGIRAAERWLGVPEASTPVGLVGASGGSIATDFASELAGAYAPDLDIVGAAAAGIPVDLFHNFAYDERPGSPWTWLIPALVVGLTRGFGLHDVHQYLTPQGIAAVNDDQAKCVGAFHGLTITQMFKPRYRDFKTVPVLTRILDHLIMGRTGTPRAPLLLVNGLSDSVGDGVTISKDVQELAYTYCQRGVPVEFKVYDGLSHIQVGPIFEKEAQAFLALRFAGASPQNGCGDVHPGNSIDPVPVPAPGS